MTALEIVLGMLVLVLAAAAAWVGGLSGAGAGGEAEGTRQRGGGPRFVRPSGASS